METAQNSSQDYGSPDFFKKIGFIPYLFGKEQLLLREAFYDYQIVRQKYILSRVCEHFEQDKFEPAPLLNKTVLDIGCGQCGLSEALSFRGGEVTAIDVDPENIDSLQKRIAATGAPITVFQDSPEALIQRNTTYDVVLCMDVFEFCEHPDKLMWAASKLLKDDGILVFSAYNKTFFSYLWHILLAEKWFKFVPQHTYIYKNFFSPEELSTALGRHELQVEKLAGVFFNAAQKKWERTASPDIRYVGTAKKTGR